MKIRFSQVFFSVHFKILFSLMFFKTATVILSSMYGFWRNTPTYLPSFVVSVLIEMYPFR